MTEEQWLKEHGFEEKGTIGSGIFILATTALALYAMKRISDTEAVRQGREPKKLWSWLLGPRKSN